VITLVGAYGRCIGSSIFLIIIIIIIMEGTVLNIKGTNKGDTLDYFISYSTKILKQCSHSLQRVWVYET
jgi:hypothetical protein